jgi:hypothetical protein
MLGVPTSAPQDWPPMPALPASRDGSLDTIHSAPGSRQTSGRPLAPGGVEPPRADSKLDEPISFYLG